MEERIEAEVTALAALQGGESGTPVKVSLPVVGGEAKVLETMPSPQQWELTNLLLRSPAPPGLARLLF